MFQPKLQECLDGATGSYIRPLIWYAGEDVRRLVAEIEAVHSAGIREFILENRGGDWFCKEPWWKVMDAALETAKRLGMRMWLLDDSHVNTGSANDTMKDEANAAIRARNLRIEAADIVGPVSGGALILPNRKEREEIVRISAYRRDEQTGRCLGNPVDLTKSVEDDLCLLDLPEGIWRVYFVLTADPSLTGMFANYITMVSRASCRHLINEVHEKIHARYASYFGNVFAGFFSDEPAFGNCNGDYGYDAYSHRMGELRRLYPWWEDFPERLAASLGMSVDETMANLPALWDEVEGKSPAMRIAYMNLITCAWRENFSRQIGQWCEEHHVEYIGHCLEDHGAHMHTGWGCGHYFRAMEGQHMAGLDIVLNQLVPGIRSIRLVSNSSAKEYKSPFYNYTLPKLGASLAHITPHMKNRVVCEVFGAYGWTCGLSMMQAIFNHFLVNGTNNFIPHAFSMNLPGEVRAEADDSIAPPGYCMQKLPPSFYMGNLNPQYRLFGRVMLYVQRLCHLLSEGVHQADVALFYNAEPDWVNGRFQELDEVSMALTRGGIDYDYLSTDTLLEDARVQDGQLLVNEERYGTLVLPYSEIMPRRLLERLAELAASGLQVIFSDALPSSCEDGDAGMSALLSRFSMVPLRGIPDILKRKPHQLVADSPSDALRFYHIRRKDGSECWFFYNDGVGTVDTWLALPDNLHWLFYDAWENRLLQPETDGAGRVRIRLRRQQLAALLSHEGDMVDLPMFDYGETPLHEIPIRYDIFMREAGKDEEFQPLLSGASPVNLLAGRHLTRCCAEFRYDGVFDVADPSATVLELPASLDGAELFLNGESCGASLGPVCRFSIEGRLKKGRNTISILTMDNPSYSDRTVKQGIIYGTKLPTMPHGFVGDIRIG